MSVDRRDFLKLLAATGVLSAANPKLAFAQLLNADKAALYEHAPSGNVSLLLNADLHAHLKPHYFMEPANLLAPEALKGKPGYLTGRAFAEHYGLAPGSLESFFSTYLDFPALAETFGAMGGAAYLTALIKEQRELIGPDRVLTLDAGDTWVTTGIGLLTEGKAVVDWMNLTGFDHMVAHWEFTLGRERFEQRLSEMDASFISHNIVDDLFGDPLFEPYAVHELGGASLGVIGSTFPYVKVAHPARFTEGLSFGVQDQNLQAKVDELRGMGVDAVIMLSHNGLPLDTALAQRISGLDLILSAHTHDITPQILNVGGTRIISSGATGKFLARIDLDVGAGRLRDAQLHLLPVVPKLLKPDPAAEAQIAAAYAPHRDALDEVLGVSDTLIYKRDSVFSTFDRLAGLAIEAAHPEVEIAFSPGFRWGTTILPGQDITMERILDFTALTYPEVHLFKMRGSQLKQVMEDIASNVFNPDPFYQNGGDMSRLYGADYRLMVNGGDGERLRDITVRGKAFDPEREYLMAAYGGNLQNAGTVVGQADKPIYELIADYVRQVGTVRLDTTPNVELIDGSYQLPN